MALSLSFFNTFHADVFNKVHNLGSDTIKLILTNVAPTAGNATSTDLTEISNGNGYSTGGAAVTITSSLQSSGVYKWIVQDVTVTASGGTIATFRYIVINNSTASKLIGWYDRGSGLSLTDGNSWVGDFDQTNGVFQA